MDVKSMIQSTTAIKSTKDLIADSGKKNMYQAIQTRDKQTFWFPKEIFADNQEEAEALATAEGYDYDDVVRFIREIKQ